MGVIYKLNPEVRKLIIKLKNEEPNLSCRKLQTILNKEFQLDISKSAINTLIKQEGLSSPVGRRRKKAPEKPIQPSLVEEKEIEEKKLQELEDKARSVGLLDTEQKKLLSTSIEKTTQPISAQIDKTIEPAIVEIPTKLEPPQLIEIKEDKIYDTMGSFFLKAAELEASDEPVLAAMLEKTMNAKFFPEFSFIGEALLYLPVFGIKQLNEISQYKDEGLWILAQQKKPSLESITKYFKQLEDIKGRSLMLHSNCSQLFQEVNYLKISLQDDTVFYIDGRFKSIWREATKSEYLSTTHYKIMSYINNIFLKNVQSVILLTTAGYNCFSEVVSEFILACEEIPDKRITKITLFDTHNKEMHKITELPSVKRCFIFAFWPWQKEFIELENKQYGQIHSCYSADISRDIYFNEGEMEFTQHIVDKRLMLRFALLKDSPVSSARMGIITNIASEDKPMQEIIQLYLRRWPNLEEGYQDFMKRSQKFSFADFKEEAFSQQKPLTGESYNLKIGDITLWKDLSYIIYQLSKYVQTHFFPREYAKVDFSLMKQRFYSLPARLKTTKDRLLISILVDKNYEFYKDLVYALRRINESDIKDNFGVKISFRGL